jgi:predicted GNAT superfamily acetyltransferase
MIVWTFDPLESINASLNFGKLGGLSDDYVINLYGETASKLHAGTTTDRLTIKWLIDSPRVKKRATGEAGKVVETLIAGGLEAPWALQADGWGPGEPELELDAPRIRCEIPVNVQDVKVHDHRAAVAWREATQGVFNAYFERGYYVRECVHLSAAQSSVGRRTAYLLEHGNLETDGAGD